LEAEEKGIGNGTRDERERRKSLRLSTIKMEAKIR